MGTAFLQLPDIYEVHVWQLCISHMPTLELTARWLSVDEQERAARYFKNDDQRRFAATRGALRILIAGYLGYSPRDCVFDQSIFGKPFLALPVRQRLDFNVSHSGDYALIAFTNTRAVGVDLEQICNDLPIHDIASICFSESEQAAYQAIPEVLQLNEFYKLWTRKEAMLKCVGTGFGSSTESIAAVPSQPLSTLIIPRISAGQAYAGAVATSGKISSLTVRQFADLDLPSHCRQFDWS